LLAQKLGYNSLIARLVPKRDFSRREENVHELLQELDKSPRATTIEAEFQSIRDGFPDVQRRLSMIEGQFDDKLETMLSELEKMTELVEQPSQKRASSQRAFIESLIERTAVKSISFHSINHPLFKQMVQGTNPDFSLPAYNVLKSHIKRLANVYLQLPERQEKSYCSLMADGAKTSADVCWRSLH
jgi:hypothetical protein